MQIAIPLFDDLTALDAIGPYEVLSRLPGAEVVFVGAEARPYVSDNGMLRMHADATLDAVPAPDKGDSDRERPETSRLERTLMKLITERFARRE